jgi:hypothetical protein
MNPKLSQITLIFLLLLSGNLQAQASEKYLSLKEKYNYNEGYIITINDQKVEGLIYGSAQNPSNNIQMLFVHKSGVKEKYRPKHLREYGFSHYKFVSDSKYFYQVIDTGPKVNLYVSHQTQNWSYGGHYGAAPTSSTSTKDYIYVKKTGESTFTRVRRMNFKEDFSRYFGDCDMIKEEILKKNLTFSDIEKIVRDYNYCK